jgi:hypothetical protein
MLGAALLASGAGAEPAASESGLARTARELRQIVPPEDTDVPPSVRSLVQSWKGQLRDFIGRELNSGPTQNAPAERIADRLATALAREGVPVDREPGPNDADGPYGRLVDLAVQRPAGHQHLLAVSLTQGISCGSDTSLYLFEEKDQAWRLAFALEANGYEEVSGALGSFDFRVSPPDPKGGFFLVAADINPWCSSNWQRLRYRAYRLGGDPLRPVPFFEESAGIYLENGFKLSAAADRFRLDFEGSQRLDLGLLIRGYVRAFRVTGTAVERIGPLAADPRGFIHEWLTQPWEVAERWVSAANPSRRSTLKAWHGRLRERLGDLYTEFGEMKECGRSCSQIRLDIAPDPQAPTLPRELYFVVRSRGGDFRMETIDVSRR